MKSIHIVLCLSILATFAVAVQSQPHEWWKEAVVYQVYPASFKESRVQNATGWGDIRGIVDRLDHVQSLGADIIWLSPFYDSPLRDMGYDVSDYQTVNHVFGGRLEDIKDLISEAHKRGIKVIFDLVINHTSDQHAWFQASNSSTVNYHRDWYIWRPPRCVNGTRHPPNNWAGNNNGSAWKYEPATGEYYLSVFDPFQPDLNWDNPLTRQAVLHDALYYWLKQGVDGFRIDAFFLFSKPAGLPNVEPCDGEFCDGHPLFADGPHEHEYLHQMFVQVLSHFAPTFTVGEYGMTNNMSAVQNYVGASRREVNTVFLTNMCDIGRAGFVPLHWNLSGWREAIDFTQAIGSPVVGDGWNTVYLENHDVPRSISRFADDSPQYRVQGGKVLAMLLSTLSGTLFVYQGQELGMINVPTNWTIDDYRDSKSLSYYDQATKNGLSASEALANLRSLARDNARAPFNWNRQGGFSLNSTTWTPAAWQDINLADQVNDPDSVYAFWMQMIRLRKARKDLFVYGAFGFLDQASQQFLVYEKSSNSSKATVILNMSNRTMAPPASAPANATLLVRTHSNTASSFEPYEGRVYLS